MSGFDIEMIVKDEAFVTAFVQAARTAIGTHQREKQLALRNAVLNVATGNAPDEDLQSLFLRYIDELTPWHLRVLRYFSDPGGVLTPLGREDFDGNANRNMREVLIDIFPELSDRGIFVDRLWEDIWSRGLVGREDRIGGPMRWTEKRTSQLGDQFLRFITSPIDLG